MKKIIGIVVCIVCVVLLGFDFGPGYEKLPDKISLGKIGGANCRCGGPADPACKTISLPSGEIGTMSLQECLNLGKELYPYDPNNRLHICQGGTGGGCANGAGNGGCGSKRVYTIWNASTGSCRYGGGMANGGIVATHCAQF